MSGPEDAITQLVFDTAGLDPDETWHDFTVEDLLKRIRSILRTYDSIDHTILARVNAEFGIPLRDRTEDDSNYTLKVHRPDGTTIDILIPVEGDCKHYDNCLKLGSSFGLNLVTEGHYA